MNNRLLVIGLDAAALNLIEPWVESGLLPNIARILRSGAYAPMRSSMPIMSPPAWTSLITGYNPGKHGIYDFVRLLPGSYRLLSTRRDQTEFRTIFDHASAHGRYVIAMNVPMTYPPKTVNGMMISGLWTPETGKFAHPPALRDELLSWGYRINTIEFEPGKEREWLNDTWDVTHRQTEAFARLLRREPWDMAMIVYRAIDEVEAFFWHHSDPAHPKHDPRAAEQFGSSVLDAHKLLDEEIGKLVEAAGPDVTVAIVSDHGGGALHREVFLNVWLEQQGWLRRRQPNKLDELRKSLMRRLNLTRESLAPRLDWPLALWVRDRIPMRLQHTLVPEAKVTLADAVDWSKTRAYSFGNIGQIYVNLRGREPEGVVEPGPEYDRLLDELTAALFELKDDGVPVVDAVYRGKEIYSGPYADYGPDLNIIMRGMTYAAENWHELDSPQLFGDSRTHCTGIHRPLGMIALSGPSIPAVGRQAEAQIVDATPTMMWLLGLPIPDDVDGQLLRQLVDRASLESQPPVFAAQEQTQGRAEIKPTAWADPEEEQEVLERLRNLGYLD
ncbi:MAG: alkaline phosphatase family protein [Kouleothrix sp.]|nr:alkaline phosphatase family protein [Kouleothrix sp.]